MGWLETILFAWFTVSVPLTLALCWAASRAERRARGGRT
jgi:hypothetical protein